jgi:hypothetical protein
MVLQILLLPVARAQQREVKSRVSRRMISRCLGGECARGGRAHQPAGLGGAGNGSCGAARDENRCARHLRCQCQTTAGCEIISLRLAPEFHDHRAKPERSSPLQSGLEGSVPITRLKQQNAGGIDPQFHQACRRQRSGFALMLARADPEHCALCFCPGVGPCLCLGLSKHERKTRKAGRVGMACRINFMHPVFEQSMLCSVREELGHDLAILLQASHSKRFVHFMF